MFVVIFEVQPKAERKENYLELAKLLRPELEQIEGFIDNERFASQRMPGRVLSLSTWRDEKALIRWRTLPQHHEVQQKGRFEVFTDYHLRVGEVTSDSAPPPGLSLAETRFDLTEVGQATVMTITELEPADPAAAEANASAALAAENGVIDHEWFDAILTPGKRLLLVAWRDAAGAAQWNGPETLSGPNNRSRTAVRHRQVRIIRDYSMADRREAPQFYPPVTHQPAGTLPDSATGV